VDLVTFDYRTFWLRHEGVQTRRMIHIEDGYKVRKIHVKGKCDLPMQQPSARPEEFRKQAIGRRSQRDEPAGSPCPSQTTGAGGPLLPPADFQDMPSTPLIPPSRGTAGFGKPCGY
jgi:hypothetical protein